MPLKDWSLTAARNGAGTDTRPLRSTLLINVDRNNAIHGPYKTVSPISPNRPDCGWFVIPKRCAATPPISGIIWDIMGYYGRQRKFIGFTW